MELFAVSLLNGISYGLLLFMLSAGLTLIFSMMGVINFAHASFYMLGAYVAYSTMAWVGYAAALWVAPAVAFGVGALFERVCLRRLRGGGHVPEILITFGLSILMFEAVQLIWGRGAVDYRVPQALQGPLFTFFDTPFPRYRAFMMAVALAMLLALWWLLARTRIGLVLRAALTHPQMVEALGHNVPRVMTAVFGAGAALAALAGVIGGNAYVTEPGMAAALGPIIFVVAVVGGLGSLAGAFIASLAIGLLQTFAVAVDRSLLDALHVVGVNLAPNQLLALKLSQLAPMLPYALMVLMLVVRPRGLLGKR